MAPFIHKPKGTGWIMTHTAILRRLALGINTHLGFLLPHMSCMKLPVPIKMLYIFIKI